MPTRGAGSASLRKSTCAEEAFAGRACRPKAWTPLLGQLWPSSPQASGWPIVARQPSPQFPARHHEWRPQPPGEAAVATTAILPRRSRACQVFRVRDCSGWVPRPINAEHSIEFRRLPLEEWPPCRYSAASPSSSKPCVDRRRPSLERRLCIARRQRASRLRGGRRIGLDRDRRRTSTHAEPTIKLNRGAFQPCRRDDFSADCDGEARAAPQSDVPAAIDRLGTTPTPHVRRIPIRRIPTVLAPFMKRRSKAKNTS
jgi:hypothetical protein